MDLPSQGDAPFVRICQAPDGPDILLPQTYAAWRYCVEQRSKVTITAAFLDERLTTLADLNHAEPKQLVTWFGHDYLVRLISWVKQARAELLC